MNEDYRLSNKADDPDADVQTSWSIKVQGSEVEPIKISCVKQRIIIGSIEPLINALFEDCPEGGTSSNKDEKTQILSICQQYNKCIRLLNFKGAQSVLF